MTPKAAAARARKELRAAAKKEVDHSKFFKDEVKLLGVWTADLRKIARGIYADVKKQWSLDDAIAFAEALLADDYLEMRSCGVLVLGRFSKQYPASLLPRIRKWIECGWLDNWSAIDLLCSDVLHPLIAARPELLKTTETWTGSKNLWLRRASAVCLVKSACKGKHLAESYRVAKKLAGDKEDLVQKGAGWLLKEAGTTDMARLQKFVEQNGKKIPRTMLRYAIEKFPAATRKELLNVTKPSA